MPGFAIHTLRLLICLGVALLASEAAAQGQRWEPASNSQLTPPLLLAGREIVVRDAAGDELFVLPSISPLPTPQRGLVLARSATPLPTLSMVSRPDVPSREASYLSNEPQNINTDPGSPFQNLPTEPPDYGSETESIEPFENQVESVVPSEKPAGKKPLLVPFGTKFFVGWIAGSGDTMGVTELEIRETLGSLRYPGWMITPSFEAWILNGPNVTDLPGALYTAAIDVMWMKKFSETWSMQLAVSPGIYSDFNNTGSGAIRVTGRALAFYRIDETLQIAFGAVYLNREDIAALPAFGLIYTPNETMRLDVVFPRPRFGYRVSATDTVERWVYVGGELGGGTWAIERKVPAIPAVPGATETIDDVVNVSSLRAFVGYEAKRKKGFTPTVEAGYIFARDVEFRSKRGNFSPDGTFFFRFGGAF